MEPVYITRPINNSQPGGTSVLPGAILPVTSRVFWGRGRREVLVLSWLAEDSELLLGCTEDGDSAVKPPSSQSQAQCSGGLVKLWAQFSGQATGHPSWAWQGP